MAKTSSQRKSTSIIIILIGLLLGIFGITASVITGEGSPNGGFCYEEIAAYSDMASVEINGNMPYFTESQRNAAHAYESYSDLDFLGRCGVAEACLGLELMPTEPRGEIGMVKPSGWHTVRYDDLIADRYLYNRAHLLAFMLTGENANEKNLITGTRYMNIEGMLPYENAISAYIRSTGNHVRYRVTPIFVGNELLARGVLMEAYSVEDNGSGVCFCVFAYNVQPGVVLDYATGESRRAE